MSKRPRLRCGAARQAEHAVQRRLDVRPSHAEVPTLQKIIRQHTKPLQSESNLCSSLFAAPIRSEKPISRDGSESRP